MSTLNALKEMMTIYFRYFFNYGLKNLGRTIQKIVS